MRREIAAPTPLHAADLQFQAFAEFDCSRALPGIQAPTLVLTGDLDQLVSPQNSKFIASLIPGARLIVIPDCGHRMMWEATDECVGSSRNSWPAFPKGDATTSRFRMRKTISQILWPISSIFSRPRWSMFTNWPWMLAVVGADTMTVARQSVYFGGKAQFGDGKPIILIPQLGSNLPVSTALELAQGVRLSPGDRRACPRISTSNRSLIWCTRITKRVGRKAVLVAPASGMQTASAIAEAHRDLISDIVVLNASHHPDVPPGVRAHFIASGWSLLGDGRVAASAAKHPNRIDRSTGAVDRQRSIAVAHDRRRSSIVHPRRASMSAGKPRSG